MAIEKHNFEVSSIEANAEDIAAWLKKNAAEYFDDVICDTSDPSATFITCKTGTKASLSFAVGPNIDRYSESTLRITLENGGSSENAFGYAEAPGIYKKVGMVIQAVTTSTGIALVFDDNDHSIFITKTNLGTTGVFAVWRGIYIARSEADVLVFVSCDLINSTEVFGTWFPGTNSSYVNETIEIERYYWSKGKPTGLTVLVPYCFIGASYSPGMYLTPFSQYPGQNGVLDCGGVHYYYNGYTALKE